MVEEEQKKNKFLLRQNQWTRRLMKTKAVLTQCNWTQKLFPENIIAISKFKILVELKWKYKAAEAELEIFVRDIHSLRGYGWLQRHHKLDSTTQNLKNIWMEEGIHNKEQKTCLTQHAENSHS